MRPRVTAWISMSACACASAFLAAHAQADAPAADTGGSKFFLWTDTSGTLLPYGWGFAVDPEEQSTFTFEHAHASKVGDLFMFIDFTEFQGDGAGSTWYGEFGPRFSFGKMLGRELSYTLFEKSLFEFKDVLLAFQYERGEDPDLAEAVLVGIGFDLDVREAGILGGAKFNYLQLNLYARAELTEGVETGFEDMQVTVAGSYPFDIGSASFLVDGYLDWVLGLGSEGWNFHFNPQLKLDAGKFWEAPKKFYVGVEIDWWSNKYQIPNSPFFDTNQQAISVMAKYHF